MRSRIHADKSFNARANSGFLFQFPLDGGLYGFAVVNKSTRERELTLEGRILSTNEKQSSVIVEDDSVDRKCRGRRQCACQGEGSFWPGCDA